MHGSEVRPGERVKDVHFTEDTLAVDLLDGRTIIVPLGLVSQTAGVFPGTAPELEDQWRGLWHSLARPG